MKNYENKKEQILSEAEQNRRFNMGIGFSFNGNSRSLVRTNSISIIPTLTTLCREDCTKCGSINIST